MHRLTRILLSLIFLALPLLACGSFAVPADIANALGGPLLLTMMLSGLTAGSYVLFFGLPQQFRLGPPRTPLGMIDACVGVALLAWAWQQHWAFAVWIVCTWAMTMICLWCMRRIVRLVERKGII